MVFDFMHTDASTEQPHALCPKHFSANGGNSYYPYFWVVLDVRIAVVGTVIVRHERKADHDRKAGEPSGVSPTNFQTLLACPDISHTTILDVMINNRPGDEMDSWFHDVVRGFCSISPMNSS